MTYQELIDTIKTLPRAERLSLLEVLAHSLQADSGTDVPRGSTLERARGFLKSAQPAPADSELEEDYTEYLIKKYA